MRGDGAALAALGVGGEAVAVVGAFGAEATAVAADGRLLGDLTRPEMTLVGAES